MSRHALPLVLLSLTAFVTPALAQPSPERGTVFIGATGFAAVEKTPSSSGLADSDDGGGTVAGGMLSVGVHLTPRVSARVDWGLTDRLETNQGMALPFASEREFPGLGGLLGGVEGGFTFGTSDPTSIFPSNYRQERQTMTGLALLGYHLGEGRVSLEVLGGLGFVNEEVETKYDVRILLGGRLNTSEQSFRTSTYHAVGVVGADVTVALTDHAAVVPSVRIFSLNNGLSLRPGVGLRWTF